ncbi:MAG: calcium-binding protein, partial [Oceanospirillum sp.]|nr:calcium-binding protein [Oceanospirillum sp.]
AILPGDTGNDDLIHAYDGDDTVLAGDGDDEVFGMDGNDDIDTGDGNDVVYGGNGNDIIDTTDYETLAGDFDNPYPPLPVDPIQDNDLDTVYGGAGDDVIFTGDDRDTIFGGDGNDSIDAGIDDDEVTAGRGDDTVVGGEGNDLIYGGDGDDVIYGGLDPSFPDALNIPDEDGDLVPDNGQDLIYGGAGNDKIIASQAGGEIYGGEGNDTLSAVLDSTASVTLDGGAGKDRLTGGEGDDHLIGGAGDDRLVANGGNDTLDGGTGTDQLRGGAGNDRYVFEDNFGSDRFSDRDGEIALDFSAVTESMDNSLSRRGFNFVNADGDELRVRGQVTEIHLGTADDQIRVKDFPDWVIDITDHGGSDDYRITTGNPDSSIAQGTLNINDSTGAFDEIILEQTQFTKALELDLNSIANGREVINYSNGQIERLTVKGKGTAYTETEVEALKGRISVTSTDQLTDLGATGLRLIAEEIDFQSAIYADHIIVDSLNTIELDQTLTADDYVDLRTWGDDANIELTADITVNDAWNGTDGWVRLQSADGGLINLGDNLITAEEGYLQIRMKDHVGSLSHAVRTDVKEASIITEKGGEGDIVLIEANDLILRTESYLSDVENDGFRLQDNAGEDRWEDKVSWDDSATAEWKSHLQQSRTNFGLEAEHGDVYLTQLSQDAKLTLESGVLAARGEGADISLTVDDIDFLSGASQVIASGDISIQAQKLVWNYFLGSAAENAFGLQYPNEEYLLNPDDTVKVDHRDGMDLSTKDLAALADGFNSVTIGREDLGNTMTLGDIKYSETAKKGGEDGVSGEAKDPDDYLSTFRDSTFLKSDILDVRGDVQALDNDLQIDARVMSVSAKNLHDPNGLSDSGLNAKNILLNIKEQLHVGGWMLADDLIDIQVTDSDGTDNRYDAPYGVNSLYTDKGSLIETKNAGSEIRIDTLGSQEHAGKVEAKGEGASIQLTADGAILLNEGSVVAARDASASISLTSEDVVAINPGSAISAGIEFTNIDGKPVPSITGAGASIEVNSAYALLVGGSVTSSGDLALNSKGQHYDGAAFGDSTDPSYSPDFAVFNKTAYFENIGLSDADHYLTDHTTGYGMLVSGTVTSLKDDGRLVLSSAEDLVVRGNVNALGANSDLTFHSDSSVYLEGFLTSTHSLNVLGGLALPGNPNETDTLNGADQHGSSVYVHETSRIVTTEAGSQISVTGAQDIDLHGALVAGGEISENGVIWNSGGSDLTVTAGEQLLLNTGVLASRDVTLTSGAPGADDTHALVDGKSLSLLLTAAGGATSAGIGANGEGGNVTINAQGDMELMGTVVAGGALYQEFDADTGALLEQSVNWSDEAGYLTINNTGQTFIGGTTLNVNGDAVQTGGYLFAKSGAEINGGQSSDGVGTLIQGASDVVVRDADGNITITGVGDVEVKGRLIAGGYLDQQRDAEGRVLGSDVIYDYGHSTIRIEADEQIVIGRDLKAGDAIDLVGGDDPSGQGIILYGSATLETWAENSEINLNAPGDVTIYAPSHVNEIQAQGWRQWFTGKVDEDVTLQLQIDKISYTLTADVVIRAEDTLDNERPSDLLADIQAAMEAAEWMISDSQLPNDYINGTPYEHFADAPNTTPVDPDLAIQTFEGRLNLTSAYEFKLLSGSVNAELLGFDLSSDLDSTQKQAIAARADGSVVNIGSATGENGKLYIAGKVLAHDAINLYSGISADGKDIELGATGVLETLDGSIAFDAGVNGELRGDIIAGGAGSDVILSSGNSLNLIGSITANDEVVISAGADGQAGSTSLTIQSTSKISTSAAGGEIRLHAEHDMSVNGRVGSVGNDLDYLELTSAQGTIMLEQESGRIETDSLLVIDGYNVDLAGVVISQFDTASSDDFEVQIKAANHLKIHTDVTAEGRVDLSASVMDLFDSNLQATSWQLAASQINFSQAGIRDNQPVMLGASLQAEDWIRLQADGLNLGSGSKLMTSADGSQIDLAATTMQLSGSLLAGFTGDSATGDQAQINLSSDGQFTLGAANAGSVDGLSFEVGACLKATGDISIDINGDDALTLEQNRLSQMVAQSLKAEGDAGYQAAN